ncbi:hypothetical protein DMN91_004079 [Ooceraea biroi]|uniref:Secreted protein n=1 Tax=Ooceraea biroi TaxID=2015173 RepID=A0A3L8DU24_OOCBI|nr:hypothetical protein DMN91_004079 [Ooceraea biroi]
MLFSPCRFSSLCAVVMFACALAEQWLIDFIYVHLKSGITGKNTGRHCAGTATYCNKIRIVCCFEELSKS